MARASAASRSAPGVSVGASIWSACSTHATTAARVIFPKTWSTTGWRLGWITAPGALGPTLLTEYNIAGPPGFVPRAGIVAVQGERFVAEIVARYRAARDLVLERVAALPRLSLPRPEAAFHVFIRVDGMQDSVGCAKDLLMETGVGLAPGAAFGEGDHAFDDDLRLCFAATPRCSSGHSSGSSGSWRSADQGRRLQSSAVRSSRTRTTVGRKPAGALRH